MTFDLEAFKRSRMSDIKAKTEVIAAAGFAFGGVSVRVTNRALLFYQSLNDLGAALSVTNIPAADDLAAPLVVNLLNIGAFTAAWKQWLRDLHAAEHALMQAIRNAADQAQVEAIQDNRVVP